MRHQTNSPGSVGQLRIIAFALIGGVVLFASVVAFLLTTDEGPDAAFGNMQMPILIWIALGFAVLVVPVAFSLRAGRLRAVKAAEEDQRLAIYSGAVLLFMAPIEGAALFNVIAWLLNGGVVNPVVVGALVAIMLAFLPNETELENAGI